MAMAVRFGTDGIRGRANDEITVELAYRLGRAVASVYSVPVFVGYDTRESSPTLAAAVLAGLRDGGAIGINLGYFTTPGVAVIAQQRGGAGIVVSASHNPYYDNGLKVLGIGGEKLDLATEAAVERALEEALAPSSTQFDAPDVWESLALHVLRRDRDRRRHPGALRRPGLPGPAHCHVAVHLPGPRLLRGEPSHSRRCPRPSGVVANFEPLRQVLDGVRSILYFGASGAAGLTRGVVLTAIGLVFWVLVGMAVTSWYDGRGKDRIRPELLAFVQQSAQTYAGRADTNVAGVDKQIPDRLADRPESDQPTA